MGAYTFEGYECFSQLHDYDFSKHSTVGVGGKAKIAFCPHTIEGCIALLNKLRADGIAYYVIGRLSNVLPPMETEKVILLTEGLCEMERTKEGVFVDAGVTSGAFLRFCKKYGKSGGEFLYGIPCSLGGALYMNGGADGKYMQDIVESVLVYHEGEKKYVSLEECRYSYKSSIFMQNDDVILGANLRLSNASIAEIEDGERHYKNRRKHLPKGRSMGCVFKNPPSYSAGELIEKSGLKGHRIGGAVISELHANFIINENNATTDDIEDLIVTIKEEVFRKFGIRLEEEIQRI